MLPLTIARRRLRKWEGKLAAAKELPPGTKRDRRIKKCKAKVKHFRELVRQIPRVVVLDIPRSNNQGPIGALVGVIGHYTAGPKDLGFAHFKQLMTAYAAMHRQKGWGTIGYHYGLPRKRWKRRPVIVCLRPVEWRGTHTALANTGQVGVVCCGTAGDRATKVQQHALRWLLANAHTTAFPKPYRAQRSLAKLPVKVHKDFNPTSCPGDFEPFYKTRGTSK